MSVDVLGAGRSIISRKPIARPRPLLDVSISRTYRDAGYPHKNSDLVRLSDLFASEL
jgi:hypothetical protein